MKRSTLTFVLSVAFVSFVPFSSRAQTSNVETVRAWTRTPIMGVPGGTLLDPTGTLADQQRYAAMVASLLASSNLVAASAAVLSNALVRLYAVAARTNDFTGRLYISADLDADPGYDNVEAYRISEAVDPDLTLHYFTHFTRELAAPPKTVWRFEVAPGVEYWSAGSVATNNATTNINGYACYDISVPRPAAIGNMVLLCHKFLKFGAPGAALDIDDSGLRIIHNGVTNTPFTGSVSYTNAAALVTNVITEIYQSGFLRVAETNTIGGTP